LVGLLGSSITAGASHLPQNNNNNNNNGLVHASSAVATNSSVCDSRGGTIDEVQTSSEGFPLGSGAECEKKEKKKDVYVRATS
jgi:hypothetical protein